MSMWLAPLFDIFHKMRKQLDWTAPATALPHGVLGILSVFVGLYIIIMALYGNLQPVNNPIILTIYVQSTFGNAAAGFVMSNRAPMKYANLFRACALFQMCLIYFVGRFSPSFPDDLQDIIQVIDVIFSVMIIIGIISFSVIVIQKGPPPVAVGVVFGSFGLSLLSGYPLQLAILGKDWWECVQGVYPLQSPAMVAYIYVSSSWTFGVILFGATLWNRKMIGDMAFGVGICGLVVVTLISTVLMQEVHYPEPASTQKLWLPCPQPEAGSLSAWAVTHLDTSLLARTALTYIRQTYRMFTK